MGPISIGSICFIFGFVAGIALMSIAERLRNNTRAQRLRLLKKSIPERIELLCRLLNSSDENRYWAVENQCYQLQVSILEAASLADAMWDEEGVRSELVQYAYQSAELYAQALRLNQLREIDTNAGYLVRIASKSLPSTVNPDEHLATVEKLLAEFGLTWAEVCKEFPTLSAYPTPRDLWLAAYRAKITTVLFNLEHLESDDPIRDGRWIMQWLQASGLPMGEFGLDQPKLAALVNECARHLIGVSLDPLPQ